MPVILKRTITTLILWAAIIALLYFCGAQAAVWMIALMAIITTWEFNKLVRAIGPLPFAKMSTVMAGLMIIVPFYVALWWPKVAVTTPDILMIGILFAAIRILAERAPDTRTATLGSTLFSLVYVPFMLSNFVNILRDHAAPAGVLFFVWVVIVTKLCDTGALLTGMACGRHKMTPVISPKKTWEGAVGGLVTSALISALFAWLFARWLPSGFTPLFAALVALPLAALGIVGDLVESVIKRRANIKDSGNLAPGIGGMFDLTDSLLLAAPAAYWLLKLI